MYGIAVDDVLPPLLGQLDGAPKGINRFVHPRDFPDVARAFAPALEPAEAIEN